MAVTAEIIPRTKVQRRILSKAFRQAFSFHLGCFVSLVLVLTH